MITYFILQIPCNLIARGIKKKEVVMKKMRTEGSIAIGILLTLFFLASSCTAAIYVPDDYTTIQSAVDAASPGDTIIVSDGTYTGNINVDKSLTIRSENGPDSTIVLDETSYMSVFYVTANYVNISGFKVASEGISLHYADYCSITNNHCLNNSNIYLSYSNNNSISDNHCSSYKYGNSIFLIDSNNNRITNNHCLNNEDGIFLIDSNTNRITNNNCLNNEAGITLSDSNNSKLTGNIMLENGISIWGDSISGYTHEIDESNTVNGKSVFYEKDIEGGRVPDGAGQVILVNCSNVVVENHDLNNAREGILIAFSSFITIKNNNCNGAGISLAHSNNSKLTGNIMLENGISIWGDSISDYTHEIDESNTVNGKPVFYWKDIGSGKVPDDAGQVILVNCSNVVVENQDLNNAREDIFIAFSSFNTIKNNKCSSNSWAGISLRDSNNNSISNNNCLNNDEGIYLRDSNNNSISNNNCLNNAKSIVLWRANNNLIYLNNFIDNFGNVNSYESTNAWNSTEEITYTYNENTYINYLGNYWDNYNGSDADGDGIGDSSYSIDGDVDFYPLIKPWANYFA